MADPLVSVLIPVFNREELIVPCVESALAQTFANLEVVVVDNCSTDRTFEVCQELARRDPRVRVFRNETNIGPVRNWMRCAEHARGRLARILFSDDLMLPDALEKSVPWLEDPDVGFVVAAATIGSDPGAGRLWYTWGGQNGKTGSARYLRTMMGETTELPASPGSSLFRLADVRRNLRLEIDTPGAHDFAGHGAGPDLLLSLLTAASYPAVVHLRAPLAFFRTHPGSVTTVRKEAVTRAYCQTRIWFAGQQTDRAWLDRAFCIAWLQRMRAEGRWVDPGAFRRELLSPAARQPRLLRSLVPGLVAWVRPRRWLRR